MKLLKPLLIIATLFALAGCGDKSDDSATDADDAATES